MKAISDNIRLQFNEDDKPELVIPIRTPRKQAQEAVTELKGILAKGKPLAIEIKQYRHKRSLDSNSYAWVLITKIADALHTSKEDIYIEMLKRYGQREPKLLSVIAEAVDMVNRATNNHCTEVGESELNGKLFKHLAILIGSSRYDSKQMSILIDGIVSEAKELNIETLSDKEIQSLNEAWGMKGGNKG